MFIRPHQSVEYQLRRNPVEPHDKPGPLVCPPRLSVFYPQESAVAGVTDKIVVSEVGNSIPTLAYQIKRSLLEGQLLVYGNIEAETHTPVPPHTAKFQRLFVLLGN
jgi:hypothetical protein